MHHQRIEQGPARPRLRHDVFQRLLGHAGIVLQLHLGHAGAFVQVAHRADKTDDRANFRIGRAQLRQLRTEVEILGLNADGHDDMMGCVANNNEFTLSRRTVVQAPEAQCCSGLGGRFMKARPERPEWTRSSVD